MNQYLQDIIVISLIILFFFLIFGITHAIHSWNSLRSEYLAYHPQRAPSPPVRQTSQRWSLWMESPAYVRLPPTTFQGVGRSVHSNSMTADVEAGVRVPAWSLAIGQLNGPPIGPYSTGRRANS